MRQEVPNMDVLVARYLAGEPVSALCGIAGVSSHLLRRRFLELGIMRGVTEAVKLAHAQGRMANRRTRKGVPQSPEARRRQSETMRAKADLTARGWRVTSSGYVEYTRGEHAGRSFHVVAMEARIGRRLRDDEVVHHIDGDRSNNAENNLALMTRSAHTRLHQREDQLAGVQRPRDKSGKFERK